LQGFSWIHGIPLALSDAAKTISDAINIEIEKEPTLDTTWIQENTVCAMGFICFKSDNIQKYWSTINHLASCDP